MARRVAPAVKVLTLLRAMPPEVRQTVLDMARDEFRPAATVTKQATRKTRVAKAAFVQGETPIGSV